MRAEERREPRNAQAPLAPRSAAKAALTPLSVVLTTLLASTVAIQPALSQSIASQSSALSPASQKTAPVAATDAGASDVPQRSAELSSAWRLLDEGDADGALSQFQEALRRGLTRPELQVEANRGRGEALSRLGRHAEALSTFNGLVRAAPSDPEVWHQRGLALFRAGNAGRAVTNLQTATTAAPRSARYRHRLADSLYAIGDARRALGEYQRAAALSPKQSAALNRSIGNAHYALGAFKDAERAYSDALALDPNDADAALYRGWARIELGRNAEAIADYGVVIRLRPNDAGLLSMRGDLARLVDDPDRALEDYRRALSLSENHGPALYGLAATLLDRGRHAEAAPIVEQLFAVAEDDDALRALALALRGRKALAQNDFETADDDLSAYLQIRPRDAEEHYNRAIARIGLGDLAGASEDLREVVRLRPSDPQGYYAYGRATLALGGTVEGVRAIEMAEERLAELEAVETATPDAALRLKSARLSRGLTWMAFGDEPAAIRDYGKILETDPDNALALRRRSEALLRLGYAASALELAERLVETRPQDPVGRLIEGRALIALGRTEEARLALERAGALGAAARTVSELKGRSWLADAARATNETAAETALNRALQAFDAEVGATNGSAHALARRAEAAWRLGRLDQAKADLDQAIAKYPMDPGLRFARADVLNALDRCEEAIRDYDHGLNVERYHSGARGARAQCKWREGRVFGALGDYVASWF